MGRRKTALGLVVMGAMLATSPVATAGTKIEGHGGYKYVTESFKLKPGKPRTFKAVCPGRTQVLGGGHYNVGGYGDVIGAHSYPYDSADKGKAPDDGWAAQLRGFGEKFKAKVYAICSGLKPEYVTDEISFPADPAPNGVNLLCEGPAAEPISGGSRGPFSVREVESRLFMDTWQVAVVNDADDGKTIKVFAICVNTPQAGTANSPVAAEQQGSAIGLCPPSAPNVVGAGVFPNNSGNPYGEVAIAATQPTAGTESPFGGWRGWIDNYNVFEITVIVQAFCLPDR